MKCFQGFPFGSFRKNRTLSMIPSLLIDYFRRQFAYGFRTAIESTGSGHGKISIETPAYGTGESNARYTRGQNVCGHLHSGFFALACLECWFSRQNWPSNGNSEGVFILFLLICQSVGVVRPPDTSQIKQSKEGTSPPWSGGSPDTVKRTSLAK